MSWKKRCGRRGTNLIYSLFVRALHSPFLFRLCNYLSLPPVGSVLHNIMLSASEHRLDQCDAHNSLHHEEVGDCLGGVSLTVNVILFSRPSGDPPKWSLGNRLTLLQEIELRLFSLSPTTIGMVMVDKTAIEILSEPLTLKCGLTLPNRFVVSPCLSKQFD
jgi:hypothetical protein